MTLEMTLDIELEPCSLVVLNFTLQFAPSEERQKILSAIADALVPGRGARCGVEDLPRPRQQGRPVQGAARDRA